MEDLPPLPASRASSRASSRQSSTPDLSESHLYIGDFVRETGQSLNFSSVQLPILDDNQLSGLSDGETILVPLSCSALNAFASMTRQLDTIITQLGTMQCIVATLPTSSALDTRLAPINASLHDLSQRVLATPPPPVQAPTRAPVPPTSVTTRPTPLPARPRAKVRAPPPPWLHPPPSILTSAVMTGGHEPSMATLAVTRTSSRIRGRLMRSMRESTPTPPPSFQATSPQTTPNPNPRTPRPPPKRPRRARRIRAPSRAPKSRRQVSSSLRPRHQSHSLRPKGDFTLPVLPPVSTLRLP